jgi:hypothetical protein
MPRQPIDRLIFKGTHNSYSIGGSNSPPVMNHPPPVQIDDFGVWSLELDFGIFRDTSGAPFAVVGHDDPGETVGEGWGLTLREFFIRIRGSRALRYRPVFFHFDPVDRFGEGLSRNEKFSIGATECADVFQGNFINLREFVDRNGRFPTIAELAGKAVLFAPNDTLSSTHADVCTSAGVVERSIATGSRVFNGGEDCPSGSCKVFRLDQYQADWTFEYGVPPNPIVVDAAADLQTSVTDLVGIVLDCDTGAFGTVPVVAEHGTFRFPFRTLDAAIRRAEGTTSNGFRDFRRAGHGWTVLLRPGAYPGRVTIDFPLTLKRDDDLRGRVIIGGPAPAPPPVRIEKIEVTQGIQIFQAGTLGQPNSAPLVANRLTMVRAYLDTSGFVPGVSGTLTVSGGVPFTTGPTAPITARPLAAIDRNNLSDTLNFLIPPDAAVGTVQLTVQAAGDFFSTHAITGVFRFHRIPPLRIQIFRIQSGPVSGEDSVGGPPSRETYLNALRNLPIVYPIGSNPGESIQFFFVPGAEAIHTLHDLTTEDGMSDLLDDLEDIQEDNFDESVKAFGLVPRTVGMARLGISRNFDNVSFGYPLLMESIAHELGHLYDLDHAPCGGPEDVDPFFVPTNGTIGEVGVDAAAGVVFPADTITDFMSYCGDEGQPYEKQWISAYHWIKLFQNLSDL